MKTSTQSEKGWISKFHALGMKNECPNSGSKYLYDLELINIMNVRIGHF